VRAFPFRDKATGAASYWRDVGTIDAYYESNMDLIAVEPELNLYERSWEIRTYQANNPPPKFVFAQTEGPNPRQGMALDSMVCPGSIVSGGRVVRSILSPNVRVNSWAQVEDSILFEGVQIGRHAKIRRAIIDKGVCVPEGMQIGFDRGDKSRIHRQRVRSSSSASSTASRKSGNFARIRRSRPPHVDVRHEQAADEPAPTVR
jgi:glucose-1-phosphate adenylyltransferase